MQGIPQSLLHSHKSDTLYDELGKHCSLERDSKLHRKYTWSTHKVKNNLTLIEISCVLPALPLGIYFTTSGLPRALSVRHACKDYTEPTLSMVSGAEDRGVSVDGLAERCCQGGGA